MSDYPFADVMLNRVTARVLAALPAAGAWDATPLELQCAPFQFVTLFMRYTEGEQAADGAVDFMIEISPDAPGVAGATWYQLTEYAPAVLAAGVDSQSFIQQEFITYTAVGATEELFVYGAIELRGTIQRIRIAARESGVAGTPGDFGIEVLFS